jgi:hypothetical protein
MNRGWSTDQPTKEGWAATATQKSTAVPWRVTGQRSAVAVKSSTVSHRKKCGLFARTHTYFETRRETTGFQVGQARRETHWHANASPIQQVLRVRLAALD